MNTNPYNMNTNPYNMNTNAYNMNTNAYKEHEHKRIHIQQEHKPI